MRKFILILILLVTAVHAGYTQTAGGGGEVNPQLKTHMQSLKKWQDMKFGLFIHWGPVSLRGTEIGWSRGRDLSIDEYDNLYQEFNPVLFNADEWVSITKKAGMKYIIITSKHHDGFCIWDSDFTDYDIMSTPFKRDILKELSKACERQGILFGTYHSICDWHHPDYTTRYGGDPRPVDASTMPRYTEYLKNQVRELIEKYDTNILWFDGEWEESWTHEMGMDLYKYVRDLKTEALINNRVDKGRSGMQGMTKTQAFAGDFGTPEQEIGSFHPEIPWESCITICRQWAWKPNDQMKSLRECIRTLAQTAGGGGNLLLNVGPMLDGRIEQRQVDRLLGIGNWLQKNGESIYGTKGGPFRPTSWLSSTFKDNKIYIHLFKWPEKKLILPVLDKHRYVAVRFLKGSSLEFAKKGSGIVIPLPEVPPDENNTVIEITLDNPADTIIPVDIPENSIPGLHDAKTELKYPASEKYASGNTEILRDEIRGSRNYQDGAWLGFEEVNFEALIDLRREKKVGSVTLGCLQNQNSWIFFPKSVQVLLSVDGSDYTNAGARKMDSEMKNIQTESRDITINFPEQNTRYIKLIAENVAKCPEWHKGKGGKAWLFVDEIIVD